MTPIRRKTSQIGKPRVGYIVPMLRGRGGWMTFSEGAVSAMAAYVDPVLIIARADETAAAEKFPAFERQVLPTVQAEDWNENTLSILRCMIPALAAARRLPALGLDLVHSLEMFPAGWVGATIAGKERAPHVLTAHGTYAVIWRRWPALSFAYQAVLRRAAAVYPVSHGTEARLRRYFGGALPGVRVHPILNGSNAAGRIDRKTALDRKWPAEPIVLSVSGIKPRKGYHVALRAFALLQDKYPKARWLIVGKLPDGEYRTRLEAEIAKSGVRGVEFLGAVDDAALDRLYRKASLFLLLSREEGFIFEGFGLVFLEAGAYGLPVVGARSGGIPDAVVDGETGLLVDQDDAEGAGQAMIRISADPKLAVRLGRAGRMRAEAMSWTRYAEEQWREYSAVLAARGKR